ncbi:MAG: hypothetical protein AAFX01_11705 [Cyanobacteria bacterium J06638_28]
MLRHDLTFPDSSDNNSKGTQSADYTVQPTEAVRRLDIQQSLNVLEELILASPRVPFSRRTLIDEDKLLEQLDRIRLNLPSVFQEAIQIIQQRDQLLGEAEQYAQEMVNAAAQEATRRLDDLGIVRQAEAEAQQVRQQLQADCETVRSQTKAEIEQWQQAAQQHWEQIKTQTEAECQAMKQDADLYAAQVLQRIEQQLAEMLTVVHNGRQALPITDMLPGAGSTHQEQATSRQPKALPQPRDARSGRSRQQPGN